MSTNVLVCFPCCPRTPELIVSYHSLPRSWDYRSMSMPILPNSNNCFYILSRSMTAFNHIEFTIFMLKWLQIGIIIFNKNSSWLGGLVYDYYT